MTTHKLNTISAVCCLVVMFGLVLALPPLALADTLYTENFVGTTHTENLSATVGWNANNNVLQVGQVQAPPNASDFWHDLVGTPDGDNWHAAKYVTGASGRLSLDTSEFTVQAADRNGTQFSVDFAANRNKGLRWTAEVGGSWYVTDEFGTGTHGTMSEKAVQTWEPGGATLDVETSNWFLWTGHPSGDPDTQPLGAAVSLPAGDITSFGIYIDNDNNSDSWAIDNFVISNVVVPEPNTLMLATLGLLSLGATRRRRRR